MAFQIKNFRSIVASMINVFRGATDKVDDMQPGSVARTLMEAPASEIEELYMQMFLGLRDAIPVAVFLSFGFDLLPAARAAGYVSISVETAPTEQSLISAGTVFYAVDGRTYTSIQDVVWQSGEAIVRVPVACAVSGSVGNAAAGVINSSPSFDDTYTISNAAITTGRDIETDSERQARFADYVAALSQGTVIASRYHASQATVLDADGNVLEYVTRVGIKEDAGYVVIYLYSNSGLASLLLVENAQNRIDGLRADDGSVVYVGTKAAGIRFEVQQMVERQVPFSVKVGMLDGYELTNHVRQLMYDIYASVLAKVQPEEVLYIGTVVDALLATKGVKEVVPVSTQNIVCGVDEVVTPGTFTVSLLT